MQDPCWEVAAALRGGGGHISVPRGHRQRLPRPPPSPPLTLAGLCRHGRREQSREQKAAANRSRHPQPCGCCGWPPGGLTPRRRSEQPCGHREAPQRPRGGFSHAKTTTSVGSPSQTHQARLRKPASPLRPRCRGAPLGGSSSAPRAAAHLGTGEGNGAATAAPQNPTCPQPGRLSAHAGSQTGSKRAPKAAPGGAAATQAQRRTPAPIAQHRITAPAGGSPPPQPRCPPSPRRGTEPPWPRRRPRCWHRGAAASLAAPQPAG